MPTSAPKYRAIGRLDDCCPHCLNRFARRPLRKGTCKACGAAVFVRTRPLDERRVLLTEPETHALEEDWKLHYYYTDQQPRAVSPEWQARIEAALSTKTHADPRIEALSRQAASEIAQLCIEAIAPRDATDQVLAKIPDPELRRAVEYRVWQLQVQAVSGGGTQ